MRLQDFPGETSCSICKEPFNSESPLQLPCGHVMGRKCISRWFETSNTCPLCRTVIFQQENEDLLPQTLDGRQAESNIAEWRAISQYQASIERRLARFATCDLPLPPPEAAELRALLVEADELAARLSTLAVLNFTSHYRWLIDTGRITAPVGPDDLEGLIYSAIGS